MIDRVLLNCLKVVFGANSPADSAHDLVFEVSWLLVPSIGQDLDQLILDGVQCGYL